MLTSYILSAVFGCLDLHGRPRQVTWTRLAKTAVIGSTSISLEEGVDWVTGDEVVIAPTSYSAWETETRKITVVSADKRTLTLNASLAHKHLGK